MLVNFEVVKAADEDGYVTVKLEKIDNDNYQEYTIDKENGKINGNYITENVVIFDITDNTAGSAAEARLLKWSDMPDGKVAADKIRYLNKIGDFDDVNVILTNNILDKNYATGLVTRMQQVRAGTGSATSYTVNVEGKEYSAISELPNINIGSVVKVKTSITGISIDSLVKPVVQSTSVDAIESGRIMVDSVIYQFTDTAAIYVPGSDGSYVRCGTDSIVKGQNYARVAVYLDKDADYGGKAAIILIQ